MKPWHIAGPRARRPLEAMLGFSGCANPMILAITAIALWLVPEVRIYGRMVAVLAGAGCAGLAFGWFLWRWWSPAPASAAAAADELPPFDFTFDFQSGYLMAAELLWRTPGHSLVMAAFPTLCMIGLSFLVRPLYAWLWLDDAWWLHAALVTSLHLLAFTLALPLYTAGRALGRLRNHGGTISVRLSARGLEVVERSGTNTRSWSGITSVRTTANAVYFFRDIWPVCVIPLRVLSSEKQADAIRMLAANHVALTTPHGPG